MAALPRISLSVPDQPPVRSVVVGPSGVVWQRHQDGDWYAALPGTRGIAWPELLAAQLNVDVLYVPDEAPVGGGT